MKGGVIEGRGCDGIVEAEDFYILWGYLGAWNRDCVAMIIFRLCFSIIS